MSWAGPIGVVRATAKDWSMSTPTLFDLPRAEGDPPTGTLLAADTAWLPAQ